MFDYLNIRVYDDDNTNLLKYWDDTYKYISRASRYILNVLILEILSFYIIVCILIQLFTNSPALKLY